MEYSAKQLNYFRICYVAFNLVPDGLRKIFKQEWDFRYKATHGEWKDTPKNGADFYNSESRKSRSRNARFLTTIQNGNTTEWDCSCLFFAILFSDSIGTTLSAAIRKDVDDLRQVRNDIAHITEAQLTDAEFKNYVGIVLLAFNSLYLPVNDVNQVKRQTSFPTAEVNNLKSQAVNLLSELRKAKSDFQVAQNTIKTKEKQVEALASDLQAAQDTIHCKEEQVECLTQEVNFRVSSFCNLTCKPLHEIIKRTNDVARILEKMKELEHGSNEVVSTIYLSGNPGCGKSQLARQLGEQLFGKWSGDSKSLFFVETINAETLGTLTDSYVTLASELGVTEYTLTAMVSSKEESPKEIIQHLKRLILPKIRKFSKWLIIADNVIDLASVRSLLPQAGSGEWGNGQVLVTTQDSTAIPTCSPHTYHESLSAGMQPDDAAEVLTQISQVTDQEQAKKVAEVLDYQPLALAAAAFYVRTVVDNGTPNYSWLTYLERLREGLREATEKPLARASSSYSKTMTAAISMAINRAAETDEVLRETFNFLSLCGSKSLPIQAAVKFVQARTTSQTEELIRAKILTSSLILYTCEDGVLEHLRLHNVVSETLKKVIAFDLESKEKLQCIAAAIKVFQYLFDEECGLATKEDYINLYKITSHSQVLIESATCNFSLSERDMLKDLIPFIAPDDLVDWLCSTANAWYLLGTDVTSASIISDIACNLRWSVSSTTKGDLLKAKVLTVRGRILHVMQKCNEALEFFQKALAIYKTICGEEDDEVAETFMNIGDIYMDMQIDNQAKHYLEKALIVKKKKYGEENAALVGIYVSLGNFFSRTGQTSKAIELYEKVLNILKRIHGEDYPAVAICYNNLGNAYSKMNQNRQAIEFYEKALAIAEKIYSREHGEAAIYCHNLARAYKENKDHRQAIELYEKELKIRVKVYGEEHGTVPDCYNNIARIYDDTGERGRAIEFFKKELLIREKLYGEEHERNRDVAGICCKVYGEEHGTVAVCYNNLAGVYYDTGQYSCAIELFEKELLIREKLHGEKHKKNHDVAASYCRLATCYSKTGKQNKAIELYEKALDILKRLYGEDNHNVALCYNNLGTAHNKMNQNRQAIEFYEKAIGILERIDTKEHEISVAHFCRNMAGVYRDIGEHSQLIELFEKELKIREKVYGKEHGTVADCYNNLARVYNDTGQYSCAIELFEKELLIREKMHGEKHEKNHDVAASCCRLATCYSKTGKQNKAIELYEKALYIFRRILGENNHNVATCYNNLGTAFSKMNQNRQAIEFYEKAIAIKERIYSAEHDSVASSCRSLAGVYRDIGEYSQAIELYQKELKIRVNGHGQDHITVADCCNNLARVYRDIGEHTEALDLFVKELNIREKVHGEEHSIVADCCNNLARVYNDTGEHFRAIELFEKQLLIREQLHGEEHEENHDAAASCCSLATCYSKTGQETKAIKLYERALDILKRLYGENNHNVASCYNNLGIAYSKMNQNRQAIEFYEKAIAIKERIYSAEHESVANSCRSLAGVYRDIGEYSQAIELYEKELKIRVKGHGQDHITVADCCKNLARVYRDIGEHTEALDLFVKELNIREKVHGEEHSIVADCCNCCRLL